MCGRFARRQPLVRDPAHGKIVEAYGLLVSKLCKTIHCNKLSPVGIRVDRGWCSTCLTLKQTKKKEKKKGKKKNGFFYKNCKPAIGGHKLACEMGSAVSKNQSISEWLGQNSTNTKKAKFMDRFIFLFLLLIYVKHKIKSIIFDFFL